MKERLFNNFSLKILSAVFAVILWTVIVNIYDPNTGYTFSNINVSLVNGDSLTSKGYNYEIQEGEKISVYVSGPKSVITELTNSDIIATADLSEVSAFADYVDIDVKVVKDGHELNNVEATPRTTAVKLNIENRVTKDFDVNVETYGNLPSGSVVSGISLSQSSVKITGLSSVIQSIEQVKIFIDLSKADTDFSGNATLAVYDSDGNDISESGIEISKGSIDYSVSVSAVKTVPIIIKYSGTPANGFSVINVESSKKEVSVTGAANAISLIDVIEIPAKDININNANTDKTFSVSLAEYLPEGVKLTVNSNLMVTVKIAKANVKELTFPYNSIKTEGLSSNQTAKITNTGEIKLKVSGDSSVIDNITISSIDARLNLTGLNSGTYTRNIEFKAPNGVTVVGTYTASVVVSGESNGEMTTGETQTIPVTISKEETTQEISTEITTVQTTSQNR